MNLSVLDEWIVTSGLPHGIDSHFAPVRELLHWLQASRLTDSHPQITTDLVYSACPQLQSLLH